MSLEKLISKYLDSELTAAEDFQLREMIASDDIAKQKFDDAVSLHLAIKEDAKAIKAPKDLLRQTEDKILMEIMKEPPLILSSKSFARSYKPGAYALAATIAAFLIVTVFNISDMQMKRSPVIAQGEPQLEWLIMTPDKPAVVVPGDAIAETMTDIEDANLRTAGIAGSERTIQSDADGRIIETIADINAVGTTDNNEYATENTGSKKTDAPAAVINNNGSGDAASTINKEKSGKESSSGKNAIVSSFEKSPLSEGSRTYNSMLNGNNSNINGPEVPVISNGRFPMAGSFKGISSFDLLKKNKIELSSFLATDYYRGGIEDDDSQLINSFSQSIAYALSDRSKFGLEFGYNEFSYKETAHVKVPIGTEKEYGMGVEGYEPGTGNFIMIPVIVEKQKQLFWGTMIYDYSIFNYDRFKINARAGAGFSSDGPLSYLRLYGKARLFSGIYFTLGTEGKLFRSKTGYLEEMEDSNWKSTLSLIYGLQFSF